MKEKDKENDQTYGLNGIRRTVGEKPLLVLQEFNETTYPSKAQTEYMVRTAHVHSEFVTVPFVSRLTDKPANAEAAIDRYLVAIGHKQLFASQVWQVSACFCLSAVEAAFPDEERSAYTKKTLEDQRAWIRSLNGSNACSTIECTAVLEPTPKGSVPGVW